jgi:hypothetical protein
MRWAVGGLVALAAPVTLSACSANTASDTSSEKAPTTTSASTTTVPASTTSTAPPAPMFGARKFAITGAAISATSWLTVALHPTTAPIQLQAVASTPLEVCPANLDGTINGSGSWPAAFHFPSCEPLDSSGAATLPATDGNFHVAFALRPIAAGVTTSPDVTVDYTATDSFVAVLPPVAAGGLDLTTTYTPGSSTTAVKVSPPGQVTPAPGFTTSVSQMGVSLAGSGPCDFATELTSCVDGVMPGQPLNVTVTGPPAETADISLAWK